MNVSKCEINNHIKKKEKKKGAFPDIICLYIPGFLIQKRQVLQSFRIVFLLLEIERILYFIYNYDVRVPLDCGSPQVSLLTDGPKQLK